MRALAESKIARGIAAALALFAIGFGAFSLVGGDEEPPEDGATAPRPAVAGGASTGPGAGSPPGGKAEDRDPAPPAGDPAAGSDSPAPAGDAEAKAARRASRAYRSYIAAINGTDGGALCDLISPGFERELGLPAPRGSCAERVSYSIGYADPRGFPVWERTALSGIEGVDASADPIRVTAAIVTTFADRDEPSIESDVAYFTRDDGDLILVKPTGALYRAVGKPDVPPEVLSPP